MSLGEYVQGATFSITDIWTAFERGCHETLQAVRGGVGPNAEGWDGLISRSADAYCKMVHPTVEETTPERCAHRWSDGRQCGYTRADHEREKEANAPHIHDFVAPTARETSS